MDLGLRECIVIVAITIGIFWLGHLASRAIKDRRIK